MPVVPASLRSSCVSPGAPPRQPCWAGFSSLPLFLLLALLLPLMGVAGAGDLKEFSVADLGQFAGSPSQPRVLIGVCGDVFDVTARGSEHYGPGGAYSVFAGRDATRALALGSFEEEDLARGGDLDDISPEDVLPWCALFREKYDLVGRLRALPSSESKRTANDNGA